MVTKTDSSVLARVTHRWSGDWTFWGIAVSVWCLNSALLLSLITGATSPLHAFTANAFSALALLAYIVVWRRVQRLIEGKTKLAWSVFAAGALAGLIKVTSTHAALLLMAVPQATPNAFVVQALAASFIGLWLMPALAVIGSYRSDFESERQQLLRSIATQQMLTIPNEFLNHINLQLVQEFRATLARGSQSAEEVSNSLTALALDNVRPLSHALWQPGEREAPSFALRDLFSHAMRNHRFPAIPVGLLVLVSLISFYTPLVGFSTALQLSILQAALVTGVLFLGAVTPFRGALTGPIVFFSVPAIAVAGLTLTRLAIDTSLPGVMLPGALLSFYVALILTLLVLSAIRTAYQTHIHIHERLIERHGEATEKAVQALISDMQRREAAEYLHGYIQNTLLTAALKVTSDSAQGSAVKNTVDALLEAIEQRNTSPRPLRSSMDDLIADLVETWRGVLTVRVYSLDVDQLQAHELQVLEAVLFEAAQNAHKHAHASFLEIRVEVLSAIIDVSATNDGSVTSSGSPGLGTHLFHEASEGRWTRTRDDNLGFTTVRWRLSREQSARRGSHHHELR